MDDDQAINESAPAPLDVDPLLTRLGYLIAQAEWRAFLADQRAQQEQDARLRDLDGYSRRFADFTAQVETLTAQIVAFEAADLATRETSAQDALEEVTAETRVRAIDLLDVGAEEEPR